MCDGIYVDPLSRIIKHRECCLPIRWDLRICADGPVPEYVENSASGMTTYFFNDKLCNSCLKELLSNIAIVELKALSILPLDAGGRFSVPIKEEEIQTEGSIPAALQNTRKDEGDSGPVEEGRDVERDLGDSGDEQLDDFKGSQPDGPRGIQT